MEGYLYSLTGKPTIVMIAILLKTIYTYNVIPFKFKAAFVWKGKSSNSYGFAKDPNIQNILEKVQQDGRLALSNFKIYYKATVIKTV